MSEGRASGGGASDGWAELGEELARWRDAGRHADLWWRDDDAVDETPALRRLLAVARVPIALAVIPANLQPGLADGLSAGSADAARVAVLQHGFSHRNHEPAGHKKAELGAARPSDLVLAELAAGQGMLHRAFGARALPVLTPPWNRIAPAVVDRLAEHGFRGLTTYQPRRAPLAASGLLPNEAVVVADCDNGHRFETYIIAGARGTGIIGINGAAARLSAIGHRVIIMSYVLASEAEIPQHSSRVVLVDPDNKVTQTLTNRTRPD